MFTLQKFIGNTGEKYAEKYLKSCGYTIIAMQYKAKFIEVDIIAKKNQVLYIFEVKSVSRETSSNVSHRNTQNVDNIIDFDFCLSDRITKKKIQRMSQFGNYYLNSHPKYTGVALGVIGVILPHDRLYPSIEIFWV